MIKTILKNNIILKIDKNIILKLTALYTKERFEQRLRL